MTERRFTTDQAAALAGMSRRRLERYVERKWVSPERRHRLYLSWPMREIHVARLTAQLQDVGLFSGKGAAAVARAAVMSAPDPDEFTLQGNQYAEVADGIYVTFGADPSQYNKVLQRLQGEVQSLANLVQQLRWEGDPIEGAVPTIAPSE